MADTLNAKPVLSVCATVNSKLSDLAISDGQLIFVHDKHFIALDFNGKRKFYTQIEELATEQDRISILAPIANRFYFVISSAVLWTYKDNEWVQLTTHPEEIVFIGTTLPELGSEKTLYVDKSEKEIKIWDNESSKYIVVADSNEIISESMIDSLF